PEIGSVVGVDHFPCGARASVPATATEGSLHELVGYADRVVRVLTTDGAVSFAVEIAFVPGGDQRLSLTLFADLPVDEVLDFRMVHIEADHLGRAPSRAAALRGTRGAVEYFQEAHQAARRSSARELLLAATNSAEVTPRARPVLEQPCFALHQVVDAHQVVGHGLDEASRALRTRVGVVDLSNFAGVEVPGPVS